MMFNIVKTQGREGAETQGHMCHASWGLGVRHSGLSFLAVIIVFTLASCGKVEVVKAPRTEADKKFVSVLDSELSYDALTRFSGETVWVYVPMEEAIIDVKAGKDGPSVSKQAQESPSLRFVEAEYKDRKFVVEYDIGTTKLYARSYGYNSTYSEEFQKRQGHILQIINNTYYEAENPPRFFVIVIADIARGIEIENILFYQDLRKAMAISPELSQDEYAQRYIADVRGLMDAIDDKSGKHLAFNDIAMEEFLAKQIKNRVNFKYTRSSFPPSEAAEQELLMAVAQTVGAYQFDDFDGVVLVDLDDLNRKDFGKSDLPEVNSGRLIHINFQ